MYSREVINTTRNLIIQHLVFGNSLLCKFIGPTNSRGTKPKHTHIRNSSTSTPSPPSPPSNNNNNGTNLKTSIDATFIKKSTLFQNSQSLKGKATSFDWEIFGLESQVIQMNLNPGSSITAETGALLEMESEIEMDTSARGGILSSFKRMFTGQGLFLTKFVNKSETEKMRITFSSPYISKILAIKLSDVGGELICQKNAFLCGEDTVEIEPRLTKNFSTGFFGGQGFILQKLRGNGMVFVHAGGSVIYRVLSPGEKIRVTTGSIVAFESTVDFQIEFVKGVKNILFSGEGLTFAAITGPGMVVLQSMPFERLVRAIAGSGLIGVSTSSSPSSSSSSSQSSSTNEQR
ncbi:hypothetical protein DICPUDRAFT_155999 [Dictyostelium purpureum]|uniref:Uncharacterized protein n=1 Tax=Dictyostelium purpureum TaxID=5786 RepID=F0ZVF6_DICPU|nr:uncharacterized protein DICPUDRAFT_155999 [Dictyostelium purpureum]EGC32079.1 hypothetical protein DICPUDRAFT_155999 [Dictyostelium purpureum]|eukprot:XP_003291402.1 hypothetical protein DICPUDRAFT_155999 [Dictyostelium purpureum]